MIFDYMDGQRFHGDEDDFDEDGSSARKSCANAAVCLHALAAAELPDYEAEGVLTDGHACWKCDFYVPRKVVR